MDLSLTGKLAFITGSGQGIGQAIAIAFAGQGARVAVNDLNPERVEATVAAVEKAGGQAFPVVADITAPDRVRRAMTELEAGAGPVDILVNNAAVLVPKLFVESTPADWKREIDVILYGTLNCTHAVIGGMVQRRAGKIVNIASDAGRIGQERDTYYAAAKAGVIAFAKSLAKEVGPSNVNVNVVSPGATHTPLREAAQAAALAKMGREKFDEREKKILRAYPLRRIGTPEDVANAVVFLASEAARHITGQVVSVNGGFCMPD